MSGTKQVPVRLIDKLVLNRVVDNFFAEAQQVAFRTQNIVPGIDFTNDPLLQGRNFSYLGTQTKRLRGPSFTHIPVNAPRCPYHHFQQDGHMAMQTEIIASMVGGVKASDDSLVEGDESGEGGPSIVYDAVVLLVSEAGVAELAENPAARDFVADALAHNKFVAYTETAKPLLEKADVASQIDGGFTRLDSPSAAESFLKDSRKLRSWDPTEG